MYLARFVLFQILHFPVQDNHNGSFIQEYVLPQLLMDIINDKKWIGVTYHSCKPYTEGRDSRKSYIDKNRCFNVPYSVGRYNDDLLNSFFYALWKSGDDLKKYSELKNMLNHIYVLIHKAADDGYNMTDYIFYCSSIEMHLEKMKYVIEKEKYYKNKTTKVEITLLYKLLEKVEPIVMNPAKYNILPKQ